MLNQSNCWITCDGVVRAYDYDTIEEDGLGNVSFIPATKSFCPSCGTQYVIGRENKKCRRILPKFIPATAGAPRWMRLCVVPSARRYLYVLQPEDVDTHLHELGKFFPNSRRFKPAKCVAWAKQYVFDKMRGKV